MHTGKYVFAQVVEFFNKYEFDKCVKRYNGNFHVRELDCWNQFLQLLFGQLTSLNSLRSISVCLEAHKNKLYHLGITTMIIGKKAAFIDAGTHNATFSYTDTQNTGEELYPYTQDASTMGTVIAIDISLGRPEKFTYRFSLTKAMEIVISHCNSALEDTYVSLRDNKILIASNNDYNGEGHCGNTKHAYIKTVLPAGTYYVDSEGYRENGYITTTITGIDNQIPGGGNGDDSSVSSNHNYIKTRTYTTADGTLYLDAVQYFDGLGRPDRLVAVGITSDRKDLLSVQPHGPA